VLDGCGSATGEGCARSNDHFHGDHGIFSPAKSWSRKPFADCVMENFLSEIFGLWSVRILRDDYFAEFEIQNVLETI
jgi:hypothetical protein